MPYYYLCKWSTRNCLMSQLPDVQSYNKKRVLMRIKNEIKFFHTNDDNCFYALIYVFLFISSMGQQWVIPRIWLPLETTFCFCYFLYYLELFIIIFAMISTWIKCQYDINAQRFHLIRDSDFLAVGKLRGIAEGIMDDITSFSCNFFYVTLLAKYPLDVTSSYQGSPRSNLV